MVLVEFFSPVADQTDRISIPFYTFTLGGQEIEKKLVDMDALPWIKLTHFPSLTMIRTLKFCPCLEFPVSFLVWVLTERITY